MNFSLIRKHILTPVRRVSAASRLPQMNALGCGFAGQLVQVRRLGPVAGPPRFKISVFQRVIYGMGSLLLMMVIPFGCLLQMPRWSALHNNRPWHEDEATTEEVHNEE